MHLSMLSPREGGGGTLSFKIIQIPHPWDKIIGQNVHPASSEGGKMSFVQSKSLACGRHIRSKSLPWGQTKLPWLARPPPPLGLTLIGAKIHQVSVREAKTISIISRRESKLLQIYQSHLMPQQAYLIVSVLLEIFTIECVKIRS